MRHQGVSEDVFAPEHLAVRGTGAEAHPEAGVACSFREPVLSLSPPTILLRGPSPLKYCRAGTHHWPCRKNIMSLTVIRSQTKCAPSKPVSA